MPSLSVRKMDEDTLKRLRIRAANRGVSMKEEARKILEKAVSAPERLGDLTAQLFGSSQGLDLKLEQRVPHEPLDLTE